MSKTKGNVIYADDLVKIFGVDAVRYFVVHEMPYENDGVITWELVVERINSDLANTMGNLVNRTIAMSNKYFDGVVADKGAAEPVDDDLKAFVTAAYDKIEAKMDELRAADALTEIFAVFKRLNKYIDETEPWVLARDEAKSDRLSTVLYNLIEGITIGTALMAPFMPDTADKIVKMLNTQIRDFETLGTFGLYPSGNKVTDKPEILFARLKEADVMKEVDKIMAKQRKEAQKQAKLEEKAKEKASEAKPAPSAEKTAETAEAEKKTEVTIDDFAKLEFKVGEVIACEEVKKSKKLLCSQVRIGDEVRQIVSGIRKYYSAEEMVGKKVMVITNLKPAKLAGIVSEGMLLCAEGPDGSLALMTPESGKDIPDGSEIG
jgi:methionyl-tRNA synthetase